MFTTKIAKLKDPRLYGLLLMSIMLLGILLPSVLSSSVSNVTIGSSGRIVFSNSACPPQYSSITASPQIAGSQCQFSITVSDNVGLSKYRFAFGNGTTGNPINGTWTSFVSNPQTISITKKLNTTIGAVIKYCWYFNDTSGNVNSTATLSFTTTTASIIPSFAYITDYTGYNEPFILNTTGVCNTLKAADVKYIIVLIAYWDWEGGGPVFVASAGSPGYQNGITAAQYQTAVATCHNNGIYVIASATDLYTYGSGTEMNLGSTYWSAYESAITTVMNLGFDGWCDDIETYVGQSTAQPNLKVQFNNALTTYLHNGTNFANGQPRLNCPAGESDYYNCFEDQYFQADYVICDYYNFFGTNEWWTGPLGLGGGPPTYVPKSPIIMLTEIGQGGAPTVSTQISDFDSYITNLGHQMLYGFGIFVYETMPSGSWSQWSTWITTTLPSLGVPPT
jgi:hypothetical protein